jgi:epoxyqueuosine reductase
MKDQEKTGIRANMVSDIIGNFLRCSSVNSLGNEANDPAWSEPLIGFSSGDDPLYQSLKDDIGEFFWTPAEIFAETFDAAPRELTVISWILPQTEATKRDNRKEREYPSERWSRARNFGEQANMALARHVVAALQQAGFRAVAPSLSPLWKWQNSKRYGFASNWSERHAAYVSGLGTFGLCDGLITPRGKAMRCGSVIAEIRVAATPRPYRDHRAYCLFYPDGKCGKCIERCPAGALGKSGHDKSKCRDYLFDIVAGYAKARFGFESYGCGLCQTGVPCESAIPAERLPGRGAGAGPE